MNRFENPLSLPPKDIRKEKIAAKELKEELFSYTEFPLRKAYNPLKKEGQALIFLGIILIVIFYLLGFLFKKDGNLRYIMNNLFLLIPIAFFSGGVYRLLFSQPKWYLELLFFIVIFYLITLVLNIFYLSGNVFVAHLKGLVLLLYDLIKMMAEGQFL